MGYGNRRNIVIKDTMWEKLRALGKTEGRSLSDLIREAIVDLLDKRVKPDKIEYDPESDRLVRR